MALARAKINLALHVLGRRDDGYHELDSIVAFANVGDVVSLEPAAGNVIEVTGPFARFVPRDESNLALRALALASDLGKVPRPMKVTLEKNLPVASGMGGGSADAAAVLKLAFPDADPVKLAAAALRLGADIPACLHGAMCRMRGVGEQIAPLPAAKPLHAVLANPGVAASTADVFKSLGLKPGQRFGDPIASEDDPHSWRNDLSDAAIAVAPEIADVLDELSNVREAGTVRMSGSGATCFALFETSAAAETAAERIANRQPQWWVRAAMLQ
ncbi:MAG: 4-(cytidine 5'-diphospho)-2-C-methyl-D-erythritol kinase [Aestuariivirga sp.]